MCRKVKTSTETTKPPPPPPPNPPTTMAGNVAAPKLLGSTPESYNGNPAKAQAFWNILANYYTLNSAVYMTNDKKVPAALTNFKTGTQGGDWASDHITEALMANPTNYGTWAQFQTAFQKQFIPPKVQQEAIKGMHNTYCTWATENLTIGTKIGATMPNNQVLTTIPRCMHSTNTSIWCSNRN